jgi:hypothetical protein
MQFKIRVVSEILLLQICNFLFTCQCLLTGVYHCAVTHLYWLWNSASFVCVSAVTVLLQYGYISHAVTKITTLLSFFSNKFYTVILFMYAFCYLTWQHYLMALNTCVTVFSSIFFVASFVLCFRAHCIWHQFILHIKFQ